MAVILPYHRIAEIRLQKVILVVGIMVGLVFLKLLITLPYANYLSILSSPNMGKPMSIHTTSFLSTSISINDNSDEEATVRRGGEMEDKGYDNATYGDRDEDKDGNAKAKTTRLGGTQKLEERVTEVPIAAKLSLVTRNFNMQG